MDIGSVVNGVVTGVTDFGAFVKLPGGETGLVHISEVAEEYVKDIRAFVQEEQIVTVKVLGLNKKGKYELSIKQVGKESAPRRRTPSAKTAKSEGGFEDMVSKWKKESEERLLDVRRSKDAKRGSGRKGR